MTQVNALGGPRARQKAGTAAKTARRARSRRGARGAGPIATGVLGSFLLLTGIFWSGLLLAVWPVVEAATLKDTIEPQQISLFGHTLFVVTPDTALILLVIVSSGMGSFIHMATSFADYVGNRRLATSWVWWYVLRLFIGIALAIVFYFAIRGGFFAANAGTEDVNPFGIAALAGLVGLFSKQATDKLREVFEELFRTRPESGDALRDDSIANPVPVVAGIEPATVTAGSETVLLVLTGEGFVPESVVRVGRAGGELLQRQTTFMNDGALEVELLADDVAEAGVIDVTVFNPEPGGGPSEPVTLDVT